MPQLIPQPFFYRALADAVLVVHVGLVLFIVGGLILILAGAHFNWPWVRNIRFRVLHLSAIAYVVVTTWFGIECGLTTLEQSLRIKGGQVSFNDDFIAYWLSRLIFFEAAPWVFATIYTAFGLLVAWSWFSVRPARSRRVRLTRS